MLAGLLSLISLVVAKKYELVAIHSDDIFAYSTVKLSSTSQLVLEGKPVVFEFENGGLETFSKDGRGVVEVHEGFPIVSKSQSKVAPNYGWSLQDNIYLQGQHWLCDDESRTIATGEIDPPRSCNNPISVVLYASPVF